jgi:predicted homoserine dehydrogenase-like protein
VAAVAKRALSAGETLDGEGGYTVWGKLVPAERSLRQGALPIGLAHKARLVRDVPAGAIVRWSDVEAADSEAARTRSEMERRFAPRVRAAAE